MVNTEHSKPLPLSDQSADDAPPPWGRRDWLLMLAAAAVLALPSAVRLTGHCIDNHEALVTVTARQMRQDGDWVVPRFNNELRLNKTPLAYWTAALSASLLDGPGRVGTLAGRLPSLLAALAVTMLLYALGRRMRNRRTGALAAVAWASSLGAVRYATNARPDMLMVLFVVLCCAAFWMGLTAESRRRQVGWFVVFWLSLGLGNLAKGPVPLAMVGLPLVGYLTLTWRWRDVRLMLPLAGPLICLAALLPWPILLATRIDQPLHAFLNEVRQHLAGGTMSRDSDDMNLLYYPGIVMVLLAPWWLLIPGALASPFARALRRPNRPLLFAWLWAILTTALFTLASQKRQHYVLPAMPAFALLIGATADDLLFAHRWFSRRIARLVVNGYAVAAVVATGVLAAVAGLHAAGRAKWLTAPLSGIEAHNVWWAIVTILAAAAVTAVGLAIAARCWAKTRPLATAVAISVTFCLAATLYAASERQWDSGSEFPRFAARVARIVPPQVDLCSLGAVEPELLHYLSRNVEEFPTSAQGADAMAERARLADRPLVVMALDGGGCRRLRARADSLRVIDELVGPQDHPDQPKPIWLLLANEQAAGLLGVLASQPASAPALNTAPAPFPSPAGQAMMDHTPAQAGAER